MVHYSDANKYFQIYIITFKGVELGLVVFQV